MSNSSAPQGPPTGPDGMPLGPPKIPLSDYAVYLARVFYGVTIPLAFLTTVIFGLRVYQKTRPVWKLAIDDYFIIAGFVLVLADWALIIPATPLYPKLYPAAEAVDLIKFTIVAIPIWSLAMTCIKTSVALTLLRIQRQTWWQVFLYSVIAVQAIYGVGNAVFVWFQCRPIEAMWNPFLPNAHCMPTDTIRAVSSTGAAINITTDLLLSLAPATFLRKLNRPVKERVIICFLMSTGLLASSASVVKTVITLRWNDPTADTWAVGISISAWTVLEEFLALLAACLPSMKPILQRVLGRFGISLTSSHPASYNRGTGQSILRKKSARTGTDASGTFGSANWDVPKHKGGITTVMELQETKSTKSLISRREDSKEWQEYPGRIV